MTFLRLQSRQVLALRIKLSLGNWNGLEESSGMMQCSFHCTAILVELKGEPWHFVLGSKLVCTKDQCHVASNQRRGIV